MIDQEEYNNVIRSAYSLCQQIYNMELSGAIVYSQIQLHNDHFTHYKPIDPLGLEIEEEIGLLYALLLTKNDLPQTFLEGCKDVPTTTFRTEYPGSFI